MKISFLFIITFLLAAYNCLSQKMYQPVLGSLERKMHIEILHKTYDTAFKNQVIVFELSKKDYYSNGKWAFIGFEIYQ
jgi:hypothetical protein